MRGNAEFPVMKGFMDGFTVKEAGPETLPPDPGSDVSDKAKLDEAATGSGPAKGTGKGSPTTMAKDVNEVAEGAKKDIEDGYIQDVQGEKVSTDKGYEIFNKMAESGVVVKDYGMNRHNVGEIMDSITKSVDDGFVVKCGTITKKETESEDSEEEKDESFAEEGPEEEKGVRGMWEAGKQKVRGAADTIGDKISGVMYEGGKRLQRVGSGDNMLNKLGSKMRGARLTSDQKRKIGYGVMGTGAVGTAGAAGVGTKKLIDRNKEEE